MITTEQLAAVILNTIHDNCNVDGMSAEAVEAAAKAAMAAMHAPDDGPVKQTKTAIQWGKNDGIVAEQLAKLKEDALDAARFRFIRDNFVTGVGSEDLDPMKGFSNVTVTVELRNRMKVGSWCRWAPDAIVQVVDALMAQGVGVSEPKVSIPMPEGARMSPLRGSTGFINPNGDKPFVVQDPPPREPPRPGMSPDERELLRFVAGILAGQRHDVVTIAERAGTASMDGASARRRLLDLIERIKP